VRGARANNLQGLDLDLPTRALTAITGVSGSGKTTLLYDVLARRSDALLVDGSPLSPSPLSTPATSTGLFDEVRAAFARTTEAKRRRFGARRFAYTAGPGQCPACKGAGATRVALDFLADCFVPCEVCEGRRYEAETLTVTWRGRTIAEVLETTVDEAAELMADLPRAAATLRLLQRVGLGYLQLGQPAPSLSGGEAGRLKLATGLATAEAGGAELLLLDEPTTGCHPIDGAALVELFQDLVDGGATVVVVEHDLQMVAAADWVVDLGPEGGAGGGRLVVAGPPAVVAACPRSHTGHCLRAILDETCTTNRTS